MKDKKTVKGFFIALLCCLFFAGCSGSGKITGSELYAESVGIDYEDGGFVCTVQVFDPDTGAVTYQEQQESMTTVIGAAGDSVAGALSQIPQKLSRRVFYSQNKVIVLGQSALSVPEQSLDFFLRDWESGLNTRLMIADGDAATIINADFGGVVNPSERLRLAAEGERTGGSSGICTLLDIVKASADDTLGLAIPVMRLQNRGEDNEHLECVSSLLFAGLRPVGELTAEQSQTLLMLRNRASSVEISLGGTEQTAVELTKIKTVTDVSVEYADEGPAVICRLDISAKGAVTQSASHAEIDRIGSLITAQLEKRARQTAESAAKYGCDLFKIAQRLRYADKNYYRAVRKNWKGELSRVRFVIRADCVITKTGDKTLRM
ncbi:MAG: hypothetical protein IKS19_01455 [Clostridia bacterium]|nr:hypothetical protein [Clostridia bacterium]